MTPTGRASPFCMKRKKKQTALVEDNFELFSLKKIPKHGLSSQHCSPSPFLKEEFSSCSLSTTAMFAKWKNRVGEETVYPQCY